MLACGQASKQAWPNRSDCKHRGRCRSRMRRAGPSARQTRQPDLGHSIRLMPNGPHPWRHKGCHASHGLRVGLNAALRKASRNKAGVGDLRQRSGNASQRVTDPGWHPHPGLHSWRDSSAMAESVGGRDPQD